MYVGGRKSEAHTFFDLYLPFHILYRLDTGGMGEEIPNLSLLQRKTLNKRMEVLACEILFENLVKILLEFLLSQYGIGSSTGG
jgi:hypothetical protein